jgi:hypothetical protein
VHAAVSLGDWIDGVTVGKRKHHAEETAGSTVEEERWRSDSSSIYGVSVVNSSDVASDYVNGGLTMTVREPGSIWLLGAGLLRPLGW